VTAWPGALAEVVDLLACPHCRQAFVLAPDGSTLRCERGHSFDVARQGYVNLLGAKPPGNADTAAMVAARHRFLSAGHYRPIADRLAELASAYGPEHPRLLEVGAGTGYYVSQVMHGLHGARGLALDVSVAAARRAAGAHPRLGSLVVDVWQRLPVPDGRIDVLLDVFAPRNPAEFRRVLDVSGLLLTVTPEPEHLEEIRGPLGLLEIQPAKHEQLAAALADGFRAVAQESLRFQAALDLASLVDLLAMGPNAFHLDEPAIAERAGSVPVPASVTAAVNLSVWVTRP
jgi:23S rRNA (guanine745-N1)-methyltransferase